MYRTEMGDAQEHAPASAQDAGATSLEIEEKAAPEMKGYRTGSIDAQGRNRDADAQLLRETRVGGGRGAVALSSYQYRYTTRRLPHAATTRDAQAAKLEGELEWRATSRGGTRHQA